jgi:hypothetical protein
LTRHAAGISLVVCLIRLAPGGRFYWPALARKPADMELGDRASTIGPLQTAVGGRWRRPGAYLE